MKILNLCKYPFLQVVTLFYLLFATHAAIGQQNPEAFLWAQSPTSAPGTDLGACIASEWTSSNYYVAGFFTNTITFGNFTLTSAGDEDIYLVKFTCAGEPIWAVSIGGALKDNTDLNAVAVSASGNGVFITGSINHGVSVTFNGNSGTSQVISAIPANGNDIFLAHYSSGGNLNWVQVYGAEGECQETGTAIFAGSGGSVTFTGRFCGNSGNAAYFGRNANNNNIMLVSKGGYDAFVARAMTTVSGTFLNMGWVSQIGGPQDDMGLDIYARPSGGAGDLSIYVSGTYGQGGGTADIYQPYNAHPLGPPQTLYKTTANNLSGHGSYVGCINSPLSSLGNWTWENDFRVTSFAAGVMGVSAYIDYDYFDNRVYVAGSFDRDISITDHSLTSVAVNPSASGNKDVYTTAFDLNGNFLWSPTRVVKLTNTTGSNELVSGISHDFVSGGTTMRIAGTFTNASTFLGTTPLSITSAGGTDIFVAQVFETNGNLKDLWRAGKSGNETVGGMDYQLGTNRSYITGRFENSTQIGNTQLTGTSSETYFTSLTSDYLSIINTGAPIVPGASLSVNPAIVSLYSGYKWFLNGVPLGVSGTSHVPAVKGLYYVEAVDLNCPSRIYRSNAIFVGEDCTQGHKNTYPRNHRFKTNTVISTASEIFEGNITIQAGVTVTIVKSSILMRPCSKITIEPGARLNIDQSTLFSCQQWKGIEVQRGTLTTTNNSFIKDAVVAVYGFRADVRIHTTTFDNNKVSVALTGFTSPGALIDYSHFTNMYVAQPFCAITVADAAYPYINSNHYIDIRENLTPDAIKENTFTGVANPFAGLAEMRSVYIDNSQNTNIVSNDFSGWMGTGVYAFNGSGNIDIIDGNTFTGGEINTAVRINECNAVDIEGNNQFTGMESRAVEVTNSANVQIRNNNQFNSTRGILLEKTLPYFVYQNVFTDCSYGVESYIDDYAPVYQTIPPPCVISLNQFNTNTYAVIVSPKMNPFICPSTSDNQLLFGNTFQYVLVSCNTFNDNTYGLTTSEPIIDYYSGIDPANTYTGSARDWDILACAGMTYHFSGPMPNLGLPNNPVVLNGLLINSSTISTHLGLMFTSAVYTLCDYNPVTSFTPPAAMISTSVEETVLEYAVYPNPAKDILTIDGVNGTVAYTITAVNGQQIASGTLQNQAATVNIGSISDGVYILTLVDESGRHSVFKFIKTN